MTEPSFENEKVEEIVIENPGFSGFVIERAAEEKKEIVKKVDLPLNVRQRRMRWHPSGKFLALIYNEGERLTLLLLPVDGGKARSIENLGKGEIDSFAWSADGRQIIYSVTNETQDAVWLGNF